MQPLMQDACVPHTDTVPSGPTCQPAILAFAAPGIDSIVLGFGDCVEIDPSGKVPAYG